MPGVKNSWSGISGKNRGIILKYLKDRLSIRKCRIFNKLSAASHRFSARAWINAGDAESAEHSGRICEALELKSGRLDGETRYFVPAGDQANPKSALFRGTFYWIFCGLVFGGINPTVVGWL